MPKKCSFDKNKLRKLYFVYASEINANLNVKIAEIWTTLANLMANCITPNYVYVIFKTNRLKLNYRKVCTILNNFKLY